MATRNCRAGPAASYPGDCSYFCPASTLHDYNQRPLYLRRSFYRTTRLLPVSPEAAFHGKAAVYKKDTRSSLLAHSLSTWLTHSLSTGLAHSLSTGLARSLSLSRTQSTGVSAMGGARRSRGWLAGLLAGRLAMCSSMKD